MAAPVMLSDVPHRFEPEGAVPRLGMIALATDLTSERDAARLIPHDRAALHVARVAFENPATPENLHRMAPRLGAAAELLVPGIRLSAIAYACTAASVMIGDAAVAAAVNAACPGVPVVTPTGAACAGFAALGIRRIAVATPYLEETTEPLVRYFESRGLEVVSARCMGIADDRDIARVEPESIVAIAAATDCPEAEGLFLSCTAMRALDVVTALEARLGKPVITSNQASLWQLMHHAGVAAPADAPGRLFATQPLDTAA